MRPYKRFVYVEKHCIIHKFKGSIYNSKVSISYVDFACYVHTGIKCQFIFDYDSKIIFFFYIWNLNFI